MYTEYSVYHIKQPHCICIHLYMYCNNTIVARNDVHLKKTMYDFCILRTFIKCFTKNFMEKIN